MTKKNSNLSSRKHRKRPRPIDTGTSTAATKAISAKTASVLASASATVRQAKKGRIEPVKSPQSARSSKATARRSERFGKRTAKLQQESKVADAGSDRSPGRKTGGGAKEGSVRARAAATGKSKSTIQRWDQKKADGVYERGAEAMLLDQRGGSNRRFTQFIESLCHHFVLHRAIEHVRTRSVDVQAAIVMFEKAFPLERPKHASRIPKLKTVRTMLRRIDISKVKPSALTWSTARPTFQAEVDYTLSNINVFRPSQIWVYDEIGFDWLPVAEDTLAPKGMHVQLLGKEHSRGSTLFVAVNKHSSGRWARRARWFLLHHHTAKPLSKTREEHCPFVKLGLACDCTTANGEPGVDIKGLHSSTMVSIAKLLIADGLKSDEEGGRNGLRPGDAFVGDLLPQHHEPEVMRLYSLAGVWALFFMPKTSIAISPLDNAAFAIVKQFVHSELEAVYARNHHVEQADVDRVVPLAVESLWQVSDAMFKHCRIVGDVNAPAVRLPPAIQTTQLPRGTPPPRSKPPSKGLGKRKKSQQKAPTKRSQRRAKARSATKRVQTLGGDWLLLQPVKAKDTHSSLLLAVARACDSQLQRVRRKARTGEPKSKRAAKREQAAAEEMTRRCESKESKATSLDAQLQRMADGAGRRIALYTVVPDSKLLSKPRIIDPRPQARPVKPVAEPSASLTAALAAPVAVRSKRKQKSAPAPAATLAFEFDAQDAEPIRIFVRDADKFGVSVFLLDRSHRGHVPEPTTLAKPPSSSPKGSSSSAPSRRGAAAPEPVADNFSLLVDHPALGPVAIGTYNPGNFCYANSMLVALAHARRLVELLAQAPLPRPSADVARAAVQALKLLVSEDEAVDLGNFFAAALLGPNRLQPDFALQQQEDGFEFAASLLQRLDESSIGSIVREQFGLRLKQKIQCTGCARRTEQSLTVLSLEVAIRAAQLPAEYKTVVPLSHLVDAHFAPEYVESNCHGAVKVLRKHSFVVQEYPPFLLLAIKRFRYSNLLNRATKLDFRVQVPQTLPVGDARYRLLAVAMHHGENAHSGHYTTLGQNSVSGEWFVYDNDLNPQRVHFDSFTGSARFQKDAYVLLLSLESAAVAAAADDENESEAE